MSVSAVKNVIIWDPSRKDAERADIVIEDGVIKNIAPACSSYCDIIYDGKGRTAAIPSFNNAHTHISMTLLKGIAEELPLMEWLNQKIFPVEAKMGAEHIRSGAELAMLEMIQTGTTSFVDMYYFIDEIADAAIAAGMRGGIARGIMNDNGERLKEAVEAAERYAGRSPLVKIQLAGHAPYTLSIENIKKLVAKAKEKDLAVQFHWLETKGELDMIRGELKMTPTEYLKETGLLDVKQLILAHVVWHPIDELAVLARPNITVVHNPNSNMKLGSGFAPIKEMIDAGVNVALGTDGSSSNNMLDMWDEMRSASLIHKAQHLDPTRVSARDVLKMATQNASRSVECPSLGHISSGAPADMILVDIDQPHYIGADNSNLPEFIVYAGSSADIRCTICAGKVLYKNGEFLTLDKERIMAKAREHREFLLR